VNRDPDVSGNGSRTAYAGLAQLSRARARIAARVVGRERELELILAAVAAGRDMLIEGPPGTSKSTLLRAITAEWGVPLVFVEGNADLTPARLIGHHNPARVLREDYSADNFVDGPLLEAMREGGFLYIEELNRAPEDTLNTGPVGGRGPGGADFPGYCDDEPVRQRRHHPAVDVHPRPAVPAGRDLPGRRSRARDRRAARPAAAG
jgi:hypothetical protein